MKSRLLVVGAVAGVAALLAPGLDAGFRSEDFLDFDRYSRVTAWQAVVEPHLGARHLVHFWRPVADLVTWTAVRLLGPSPVAIHLLLLGLHVAAALALFAATRRLLRLSNGAALTVALLAIVQPLAPAALTYFDGGTATLLAALFTFLALTALGRWRDGDGRMLPLQGFTLLALLSYDPAILVPVILCLVAWLLPRSERGIPWSLILQIPAVLLVRYVITGYAFGNYPVQLNRPLVVEFLPRLATGVAHLFVPVFPGVLHGSEVPAIAIVVLSVVSLCGIAVAVVTRRGHLATAVRQGVALGVLVIGLFGFAPELLLKGDALPPNELMFAYKTVPAALAAALATGWLLGRAAGRRWWGSLALALPWIGVLLWLRAPIAAAHVEALSLCRGLQEAARERADAVAPRRLLLLDVPLANQRGGADFTRVFQYGMGSSLRPPCTTPERFAYPVFSFAAGTLLYVSEGVIAAFANSPWLDPVRCTVSSADSMPAGALIAATYAAPPPGLGSLRLFPAADGLERVIGPKLSDAPVVEVTANSEIEIGISGQAPGGLRVMILNRLFPCYAGGLPNTRVERSPGSVAGVDRLRIQVAWLSETVHLLPLDVVFLVAETRPDPLRPPVGAAPPTISNVLPVRLREQE